MSLTDLLLGVSIDQQWTSCLLRILFPVERVEWKSCGEPMDFSPVVCNSRIDACISPRPTIPIIMARGARGAPRLYADIDLAVDSRQGDLKTRPLHL